MSALLFVWLAAQLNLPWHAIFSGDMDAALGALRSAVDQQGPWKLPTMVALIALLPFVLVPVSALFIVASLSLPPMAAVLCIICGSTLNAALAWAAGRQLGEPLLKRLGAEGKILGFLRQGVKEHPWLTAAICRSVPVPYAIVGISAAIAGLGFWHLVLSSLVVVSPWALLYVFSTEAVRRGDLRFIGLASAALGVVLMATWWAKNRAAAVPGNSEPLTPRSPAAGPLLTLYTVSGHDACLDARHELYRLRDELGFEVQEVDLSGQSGLDPALTDHAPVLYLGPQKLFSFQIDENALRTYLKDAR